MGDMESTDIEILHNEEENDIEIMNKSLYRDRERIKKERQRMYKKSNRQFDDDLYRSKRFGMEYNAKDQETQKIMKEIAEYKKKKEAEERERQRLKEEEE